MGNEADFDGDRGEIIVKNRLMVIAFLIFLILFFVPTPAGLSIEGQRCIALFALIFILWLLEVLPLPVTALMPGIGLFLLGIVPTPADAFKTYANPAVFFVLGSLIFAQGVIKSGLCKRFSLYFISRCRNNLSILLFMIITISALTAAFVSDHLVAAMLLPVIILIVRTAGIKGNFRKALVFGIAFGCAIGGLSTPSGGARNIIVLGLLNEIAEQNISYLEWMIAGFPITLVLIPITWFILIKFYPPPKNADIETAIEKCRAEISPKMSRQEMKVLLIFVLTITLFIFTGSIIGLGTIAILGALLLFITGTLDWKTTESGVNWGVIYIYGAALSMGFALKDTGAGEWLAHQFLSIIPWNSEFVIYISVALLASILTQFVSDGAAASILAPITIPMAIIGGADPRIAALCTAIPCAFSFLTIFGTPPNAIVYSSGYFNNKDIFGVGKFMAIAAIVMILLAITFYWKFIGIY